jgi:hypothetical protein
MGLFSTTDASMSAAALPLFQARLVELGETIPGGEETDQTAQKTKWHQASSEIVRSGDSAADVASMTREIKSPIDR